MDRPASSFASFLLRQKSRPATALVPIVTFVVALLVGSIVVAGWTFNIPALKSVAPGFVTMKLNTALGFIALSAVGLLLSSREPRRWKKSLARLLLLVVAGGALATFAEYIFRLNLGIDEFFIVDFDGRGGKFPPGRMAPITIICFELLSAGFWVGLTGARSRRMGQAAQYAGLFALVISFQGFVGYLIGLTYLFGSAYYTQMALHTTVCFVLIAVGLLGSLPERGIFESLSSDLPSARMARQMLVAVVLVPIFIRWTAKLGFDHGFYDEDFMVLMQVMGGVILMATIVFNSAVRMRKGDEEIAQLFESERRARLKAEEASIAKTNFLANVSHEIRTPLGAVLGYSELLANHDMIQAERLDLSDAIKRNGQQLLHLIDDILDVSKVETGHLKLTFERFSVAELYRDLEAATHLAAVNKKIDLVFTDLRGVPAAVETDRRRLRQILCNLILNAVKFTPTGGRIGVSAEYVRGSIGGRPRLRFVVEDNGIGIAPEESALLFRPFAQVDESATRRFGGTGLGLALSRRLARALGGDVQLAKSTKGSGSIFVAEVEDVGDVAADSRRLDRPDEAAGENRAAPEAAVGDAVHELSPPPLVSGSPGKLSHVHILLVEDSKDNQILIARFLRKAGAVVEIANDGVEGIDKAMHGSFDVVLMDLQMPRMDGYEATRRLRAIGYKTPILALTAHALTGDREKCLDGGFSDHLAKPVEKGLLIDAINRFKNAAAV